MVDQLNRKLLSVVFRYPTKVFLVPNIVYRLWLNIQIKIKLGELPNYRLATGIVLTFLVNNKLDKSELGPALEWEQK